ncbi:MAG: UDP-N-acetylglucosamine 2-epimerase [Bacteroidetes bacterium GWF2_38_335]|nr:MAG: UDP-N-acetylglucosamine 2-epimerase [Bacteroidetes bacterium GWF2_38_335]HBS88016.1 UDP-N-acetylglucosamine 2-epimerase (non-hydrolyzing) [Bacteroidales bacterium]
MKIITIIGARPQFIKAAAVSREILKHKNLEEIIIHTGQHFDENMSDIFFRQMDIPVPKYNLNINSIGHGAMTGQMLEGIEKILLDEKPEWVMVYGDTNSTIAGALAAKKLHIKVAHVEAGLRSFNMKMPEEINRILTDRISDLLLCPTDQAIKNLFKEGFDHFQCRIVKTGDVMQDAALFYSEKCQKPSFLTADKFALATIHRAENTDEKSNLENILIALNKISGKLPVVIPIHPRTIKKIKEHQLDHLTKKLIISEPVGYLEMVYLLKNCSVVMTDSGGLQKEAFFFKKPCVTLREETEWVELVENGFNTIAGTNEQFIISSVENAMEKSCNFDVDLYGMGKASEKIIEELLK